MPLTQSALHYTTSIKQGRPELTLTDYGVWLTEKDLEELLIALRKRKQGLDPRRRDDNGMAKADIHGP